MMFRRGFTLIEVNLAMFVMAVGTLGLVSLYSLGYRENQQSNEDVQAAAVADYRPAEKADRKIKKKKGQEMILTLVENPDVAKAVGEMKKPGQTLVGFAAETDHTQENALEKLAKKNLDLIVANDVTREGAGFNTDTNIASLISRGGIRDYPLMSKRDLAGIILDSILEIRNGAQS